MYDVIVIGGGAAGYGAALYAARYKLDTLLIAKEFGGTGMEAHLVENWIGEPSISGMDLMDKFKKHVTHSGVKTLNEEVLELKKDGGIFKIKTAKKELEARSIIFSAGMKHRHLNCPGEMHFQGKGVSYCFTCDGPLYKDKIVAIVGGSDAAATGALLLAEYAKKVYVIYRRDRLRAEPITSERVYAHPKIEVLHNTNIVEIKGSKFVEKIHTDDHKDISVDGVFVQIGAEPNNNLAVSIGVDINEFGFVIVDKNQATNISGFFAAGDISDKSELKQFITAAAEGSIASYSAYKYVTREFKK